MVVYNTLEGRNRRFHSWEEAYRLWYHSPHAKDYEYYAVCLCSNVWIPFRTKEELACWWQETRTEKDLNVTGKDTIIELSWQNSWEPEIYLRPWQIIDWYGRSVDIRHWDFARMDLSETRASYCRNWQRSGGRKHMHCKSGPSGWRRAMIQNQFILDEDSLFYKNMIHQHRHMRKFDLWGYLEDAHIGDWKSSKCWKDQCKADRQYWKHKPYGKHVRRQESESLEETAKRIMDDLLCSTQTD